MIMKDQKESIHLSVMPEAPAAWEDAALAKTWEQIIDARAVVTGALEVKRAEKVIGASLEAAPEIFVADAALAKTLQGIGFADVCITSGIAITAGTAPEGAFTVSGIEGIGVVFKKADGDKCPRCWRYTTDTGAVAAHPDLCARCGDAVEKEAKAAAA